MLESYFVVEKHAKKKKKRFQFRNNIYSTHNVLLSSLKKKAYILDGTQYLLLLSITLKLDVDFNNIWGFFFYPRRANFYISEE